MTEEIYINIFNTSLDLFLKDVSTNYNLDKEDLYEIYKYNNMKKVSGYMLFVKEIYKTTDFIDKNFTDNSKIISVKWKTMTNTEKEKYNKIAREINNNNKKEKEKKKKRKTKEEKINLVDTYNDKLNNTSLILIEHDGNVYYKDCFDNIINVNGEYVLLDNI